MLKRKKKKKKERLEQRGLLWSSQHFRSLTLVTEYCSAFEIRLAWLVGVDRLRKRLLAVKRVLFQSEPGRGMRLGW